MQEIDNHALRKQQPKDSPNNAKAMQTPKGVSEQLQGLRYSKLDQSRRRQKIHTHTHRRESSEPSGHLRPHQSTAHPLLLRKSSHAAFSAVLGRRSFVVMGTREIGSTGLCCRCFRTLTRSNELPDGVTTGSCMISKLMLSMR